MLPRRKNSQWFDAIQQQGVHTRITQSDQDCSPWVNFKDAHPISNRVVVNEHTLSCDSYWFICVIHDLERHDYIRCCTQSSNHALLQLGIE